LEGKVEVEQYFKGLKAEIERVYDVASKARSRQYDPSSEVEALPAGDIAARVEGRVGPKGIAEKIRAVGRENITEILDSILDGEFGLTLEERIEQAVRTSLDILTEGVAAASMDGISEVSVKQNPDGSNYLSIYFSGPIRSAGGTGQGMAVLLTDYIREKIGLSEYRPTKDEVERYVEEIKTYNDRVTRLQYMPSDDDIRKILEKNPVCVNGEPTEKREVSIHRDLPRVETNRIRGGMCLVIAEGIAQKSAKLMRRANKMGLDWDWLSELGSKIGVEDENGGELAAPTAKFMSEIVGGRPIFAAPSAKGAFRLRYGKSRSNGIAAKSIHPASMILTGGFIATGTQVKVEKPGKGCIITECDTIEGPIVKLDDDSVVRVESIEQARDLKPRVKEILFLGDILIPYGDFLQFNMNLAPAGYCEEWWQLDAKNAGVDLTNTPSPSQAVELSLHNEIPLHPRYTYAFKDVDKNQLKDLVAWILTGRIEDQALVLPAANTTSKRVLEFLGVPHDVREDSVLVSEHEPLLTSLGITSEGGLNAGKITKALLESEENEDGLSIVRKASSVRLMDKIGTYIGCRMGRPEKAKERKMQPAVHSLFPIGQAGGRERSINKALDEKTISVNVVRYKCASCGLTGLNSRCAECGSETFIIKTCPICAISSNQDSCPKCGGRVNGYHKTDIDLKKLWAKAVERIGRTAEVKGVIGMISQLKIPEPLEKGLLRSLNKLYVFKDGTIRFDATDAPLTHFKPSEIGVSVEKLRQLGYETDYLGVELTEPHQILELKVQDVVIPLEGAKYMLRVAKFVDELLTKFYNLPAYYSAEKIEDLLGQLICGLAPHISAAITGRIVGFTRARVCYAHPFWHTAKRRNCDGDEDSFMLLLEVLLNFSRKYLPEKRGGQMDAPLVVTTLLNPLEVDDESHKMEVVSDYGREFYENTLLGVNPSQVNVPTVSDHLNETPYAQVKFTHDTTDVTGPILQSEYVKLQTMVEKVEAQLHVAEKIRAIDERDVAELVINSHFLRDTYGNLRAFARQRFRCVKCNENYRRVPLVGKCTKCGGKILLTVTEGNIRKYLNTSQEIAKKYGLSDYLRGRLKILDQNIESLFTNDLDKQASLSDFM